MLFSTNYFGCIPYFQILAVQKEVIIDIYEQYKKQSWRTRTQILGGNGLLTLSVPVKRPDGNKTLVKNVKIEYKDNWQKNHWKAIESSYKHAPFFFYYGEQIKELIYQNEDFLHQYNTNILRQFIKWLDLEIAVSFSSKPHPIINLEDFRVSLDKKYFNFPQERYIQVFSDRLPFYPNLSILDVLMNEGPLAHNYIVQTGQISPRSIPPK